MRWLIGIFAVLLTLWCGWWFAGRHVILSQTEKLIEDQRAAGAVLALPGFGLTGFPNRFDLSTDSITWRDASGRFGYEGSAAVLYAMSWKPWHLIFALPESQVITLEDKVVKLDGKRLHASIRAAFSTDLRLALAALTAEELRLSLADGAAPLTSVMIDSVTLRVMDTANAGDPQAAGNRYQIGATLLGISPDPALVAAIAAVEVPQMPETPLPGQIERFHLNALVTLTAPLDRHLGETRPKIAEIDLADASLSWGALQVVMAGSVSPDAGGYAAGTVSLTISGWQHLPRLLVATDTIQPNMAGFLASMLNGMASEGDDPTQLRMDLVLRDGLMNFGPLPLGPAPKLGQLPAPQG